jgi:hypothetical protein
MAEVREQVPERTTPTWEMELLVSGATIFGLLQLPQLIDHGYFRAANLLPQGYALPLQLLWMYSKIAVVTLVITFLAHLCLRGYWVALVGLNSVLPGGIRWERMNLGPIARERLMTQDPEEQMAQLIEGADNRATGVFGTGVAFAMLMLAPLLLVLFAFLGGLLVQVLFGERYAVYGFFAVLALIVPRMLVGIADRRFASGLEKSPALRRRLGAVAGLYSRLGFGVGSNPLVALMASRAGRLRFVASAMVLIMIVAVGIVFSSRGRLPFGLFTGLGASDPYSGTSSPAAFYADERGDAWAIEPLPHIPARVVQGPYLEVFVPFLPRLHGAALPLACRGMGATTRTRARLDCLARMIDIRLDGTPVPVSFDATTDPVTGQQGLLAMIPTAALAVGRHELSLNEPDRRALDQAKLRRYRIPFWK